MPVHLSGVNHGWLRAPILAAALVLAAGSALYAAEDCATCHTDLVEKFPALPHGKAFRFDKTHAGASCESCHGAGQEHAASDGDIAKILSFKGRTADPSKANEPCLACHENSALHSFWQASAHEAAGLKCADCHAVHQPEPAREPGRTLSRSSERCLDCHKSVRRGLNQRSRHPIQEGKMECVSCHSPHGSASEAMLRNDSVNDLCYTCHQEKRGPFLWEHSPVREGCTTCHTSHGSNHDKMLVSRTVQLCQSCHLQGRHQTVAGVPEAFWNQNRQCLNCHSQIHGSNHPSGPLFQR